jgi:hypothetical protein
MGVVRYSEKAGVAEWTVYSEKATFHLRGKIDRHSFVLDIATIFTESPSMNDTPTTGMCFVQFTTPIS